MLDAICVLDEQSLKFDAISAQTIGSASIKTITYSIFTFAQLPFDEIERLRQQLFCPACFGRAYFRKASSDGKAACFGSRYHQADCIEFKPSAQKSREEQDAIEVHQQLLDADGLIIDFCVRQNRKTKVKAAKAKEAKASNPSVNLQTGDKQSEPSSKAGDEKLNIESSQSDLAGGVREEGAQYQTNEENPQANSNANTPLKKTPSQGLEKLLHSLLRGSDLATSDLWVYTDAQRKYRWRAKNLFVNFADAEPEDPKPHLFWGTLSHTDVTMTWLNPADSKDIGIPIAGVKDTLFKQFAIKDKRDLEGAGLILFGKCFWNKEKSRKIIQLWDKDISRIYISRAED
ncbi:hypothetical protein L9G16_03130 [Shewanella sp. A25]|nr:hypothetical protein [Shewanella shenzhenensis]